MWLWPKMVLTWNLPRCARAAISYNLCLDSNTFPPLVWFPYLSLVPHLKEGPIVSLSNHEATPGHLSGAFVFLWLVSTPLGSALLFAFPSPLSWRRKSSGTDCLT